VENVSKTVLDHGVGDTRETQSAVRGAAGVIDQFVTLPPISQRSVIGANNMVDGMIAQDLNEFDAAALHFSVAFQPMFPEYDSERILKAAVAYVSALFAQSKLKDDKSLSREETLHDERWGFVRSEMLRVCEFLDIPKSFGNETTDFLRYHAIRDDVYMKHLLEAHRVLMKRVAGRENYYREVTGLYLAAVALHDRHDKDGIILGRQIMKSYYDIIFEAMKNNHRE
jgi:hypothetical protein